MVHGAWPYGRNSNSGNQILKFRIEFTDHFASLLVVERWREGARSSGPGPRVDCTEAGSWRILRGSCVEVYIVLRLAASDLRERCRRPRLGECLDLYYDMLMLMSCSLGCRRDEMR
jgi:hypothetical protein